MMNQHKNRPDFFDQVTLFSLLEMYEQHFANKTYIYETDNKVSPLQIHFKYAQFPHLIGLQYFNLGTNLEINAMIKSGELTISTLKEKNPQTYEEMEYRIMFFSLMVELMAKPKIGEKTRGPAKVMFYCYDIRYNWVYYLGVSNKGSKDPAIFYPMTFIEDKGPRANKADRIQAPYKSMRILDSNGQEIHSVSFKK